MVPFLRASGFAQAFAAVTVHLGHGFFVSTNGVELPTLYLMGAVVLALAGVGQYSPDYVLGLDGIYSQMTTLIALAVGLLGALGNLALCDVPKPAIRRS